jgi:hypothetical protein
MRGGHCIEDHPAIDAGWYFWTGHLFDREAKPIAWMPLPSEKAPAPRSELAWLIELSFDGVAHWWYGSDFTPDANQAIRFCRREDAHTVILERGLEGAEAVEHMWHEVPSVKTSGGTGNG